MNTSAVMHVVAHNAVLDLFLERVDAEVNGLAPLTSLLLMRLSLLKLAHADFSAPSSSAGASVWRSGGG